MSLNAEVNEEETSDNGLVAVQGKTRAILAKLARNEPVPLNEVLAIIAPSDDVAEVSVPSNIPLPAVISVKQRAALQHLSEVYGTVVPTSRRKLDAVERKKLLEERLTLDEIEKLSKKRKEAIRTTAQNHFDVLAEEEDRANSKTPRDKDGHYILEAEVDIPDTELKFRRELRNGSPSVNLRLLEALANDPDVEGFTRKEFNAMTTPVRVIDEHKVMMQLKKNPALVRILAQATEPGTVIAAFTVR